MTKPELLEIEASLFNQKVDVRIGNLDPAEFVRLCRVARKQGVELRENIISFAQSIDPTFND